jgi:hypothetical protein
MPVVLNLPLTSTQPFIDEVKVYKRVDATSFSLLGTLALGTLTFTDPIGLINDEYHVTFSSSTLGVESLPSNIYRAYTPWRQAMGVILQLQTTSPVATVDQIAVYRRKFGEPTYVRLATLALGTEYYTDPAGAPGDEYHTTFLDSVSLAESQPSPSVIANAGSGMVVVTGFDRDIRDQGIGQGPGDHDPLGPGPHVYIELVTPRSQVAPSANGGLVVRQNYKVQVNGLGSWNVELLPNDLYTSPETFYKFTFTDGEQYFKRLVSANGAAQNFSLLEDVDPLELR